jgi:membrane-associated protease RseP (regulator of RpoE activity)
MAIQMTRLKFKRNLKLGNLKLGNSDLGILILALLLTACGTTNTTSGYGDDVARPELLHPQTPLTPKGRIIDPNSQPIVHALVPGRGGERAGLKPNDLILALNGKQINSIADYDVMSKFASKKSVLVVDRGGHKKTVSLLLDDERPRAGIQLEPMEIPVIRLGSPMITTIHKEDMTVHAQASINNARDEIHVNFIIESVRTAPTVTAKLVVYDVNKRKSLLTSRVPLEALGAKPILLIRKIHTSGDFKDSLRVGLNILNDHFVFEFQ